MSLLPFCQWLGGTPGRSAPRGSVFLYPGVHMTHVLTLCFFLGLAVMWDLRLLGVTFTTVPMTQLKQRIGPWMTGGFIVMIITGTMLFCAIPVRSSQRIW